MSTQEIIDKARDLLCDSFEPNQTAYFVTKNEEDEGGEDFCHKCIDKQVKEAHEAHKEMRKSISEKFQQYIGYPESEIKKALKEYPNNARFGKSWHDPDFSGGRKSPATCYYCGALFDTDYYPDLEEANYLKEEFGTGKNISPELAWQLRTVLHNFDYKDNSEVEIILLKIANQIIENDK